MPRQGLHVWAQIFGIEGLLKLGATWEYESGRARCKTHSGNPHPIVMLIVAGSHIHHWSFFGWDDEGLQTVQAWEIFRAPLRWHDSNAKKKERIKQTRIHISTRKAHTNTRLFSSIVFFFRVHENINMARSARTHDGAQLCKGPFRRLAASQWTDEKVAMPPGETKCQVSTLLVRSVVKTSLACAGEAN